MGSGAALGKVRNLPEGVTPVTRERLQQAYVVAICAGDET
jgi:hypothetical protein